MGRRCVHWGGLAALGTVVACTPVLAQTADGAHLTIAPQVVTTYDSNVARSDAASAAARHLTPEDVYVQPAITIDALSPVGRESVFLAGSLGYDFYDRNTVLNRERINLTGGVSAQLSRCLPQLKANYGRSQAYQEELLPGPGASKTSPQNATSNVGVAFVLACPSADGLSPTISISHNSYDNSNKLYKATDNSSNSALAGLSYARPGFGSVQVYGSFTSVDYDNTFAIPFPPFEVKNSYDLYAGGLRFDRPIGSRLSGTVSVAYTSLVPSLALNPAFSGLTYSAELFYQLSPRLALHALTARATRPTNEVGADYYIDNTRQADASFSLGPRLKLTLGGSDDPRSYQVARDVVTEAGLLTSERLDRLFASANFSLNRRLSVSLNATNEHRSGNLASFNYTDNRVSLTLNGVF